MGEVVNLRRARKRKAREGAAADAAKRRTAFGVAPAAKRAASEERELAERRLSGHRLDEAPEGRDDDR